MQASLNFPNASRNRLYDRNAKVLFKRRDDTERVPARSQDVDSIRPRVREKLLLDERVHDFRRDIGDRTECNVHAFHGDYTDTTILKIFRITLVEVDPERGDTDNFPELHRPEYVGVIDSQSVNCDCRPYQFILGRSALQSVLSG